MSRCTLHILVLLGGAILWSPSAFSQQSDCFESATTNQEMNRCGETIIIPLEKKVSAEFARLEQKFGANEEMLEILRLARNNWDGYRNFQCMFEGAAAAGGRTQKPLPIESNRVFMRCVSRTLNEMYVSISKL